MNTPRGPIHPDGVGWWWMSFADGHLPKGEQFLGALIIDGVDIAGATQRAWARGLNPGGEWRDRLLTREECARVNEIMAAGG